MPSPDAGPIELVNNAFIDRLKSDPEFGELVVVGGFLPGVDETSGVARRPPYVAVFADNGQYTSELAAQMAEMAYFVFQVTLVAEDWNQLNRMGDRFVSLIQNWRPEIPGRRCFKATHNFSTPDNTTNRLLPQPIYRVDEVGLRTVKAKVRT